MTEISDIAVLEAAHAADSEYILRQYSTRGYQTLSFIAPLAYTGYAIARKRPWTLNHTLRATWIGGLAGAAAGGGVGWAWASTAKPEKVHIARTKMAYDRGLLRLQDHATIGMLLGAMLTPAILLRRARAIHLILGGAGIGSSIGVAAHWWRTLTETRPPPVAAPPKVPS